MPHVVVKLWPGKSEQQKQQLAAAITENACHILNATSGSVSVSFEEVGREEWMDKVYQPDIAAKPNNLYKAPGYTSV